MGYMKPLRVQVHDEVKIEEEVLINVFEYIALPIVSPFIPWEHTFIVYNPSTTWAPCLARGTVLVWHYPMTMAAFQPPFFMALSIFNSPLISDANLINYYRLNGDATDYTGAANGTANGSPTYSTSYSPFGDGSQGIFFNNATPGGAATMWIAANFLAPGSGDFTYYAWMYVTGFSSTPDIIHNEANGGTGNPHIYFSVDTANSRIQTQDSDSGVGSIVLQTSGISIVVNTWYQVAMIRTGGTMYIYINARQCGSIADALTSIASSNGQLGRRWNSTYPTANSAYQGYLCDVAMFNRALTVAELHSLYDPNVSDAISISESITMLVKLQLTLADTWGLKIVR